MPRIDAYASSWMLDLVEMVQLQSCARKPIYAAFDLWKDSTLRRVGITFRLPPLETNPVLQMAFDVVAWCVPMPWTLPRAYSVVVATDSAEFCWSSNSCQFFGPCQPSQTILPILQVQQPMDVLGMDYLGPNRGPRR